MFESELRKRAMEALNKTRAEKEKKQQLRAEKNALFLIAELKKLFGIDAKRIEKTEYAHADDLVFACGRRGYVNAALPLYNDGLPSWQGIMRPVSTLEDLGHLYEDIDICLEVANKLSPHNGDRQSYIVRWFNTKNRSYLLARGYYDVS